jgi:hypothetical protein
VDDDELEDELVLEEEVELLDELELLDEALELLDEVLELLDEDELLVPPQAVTARHTKKGSPQRVSKVEVSIIVLPMVIVGFVSPDDYIPCNKKICATLHTLPERAKEY